MTNESFCTMYNLYYEKLLSFANTHLSDCFLAEDLVQDTFLFFYEQDTLEDFSTKKRYLFPINTKAAIPYSHRGFRFTVAR